MSTDLEILKACVEFHVDIAPLPTERYADAVPILEDLLSRNLIDYGVSLRTAFATWEGIAYLRSADPAWAADPQIAEHLAEYDGSR